MNDKQTYTGTLYIVPTPIGNLEDITLRAVRILRESALIAAEDTRTTGKLLQHYDIDTALTSYHEHNKMSKLDSIFDTLVHGDVALVSDAGTPSISDPGFELVRAALMRGIAVVPLPGATAITTALVASGLPTDGFVFIGFLPKKDKARRDLLAALIDEPRTLIAYESPHRLTDSLAVVARTLGEREVCVARELTKLHEEFQRGAVSDVLDYYTANPPRGEIVLLIAGKSPFDTVQWDEDQVRSALQKRRSAGESLSDAAKAIAAESGWKRKAVYALGIEDE